MEIGTGIAVGCAIFGIAEVVIRLFPKKNNPSNPGNSKYLLEKVFIEFKEGVSVKLNFLETSIQEAKSGVKRIHERLDLMVRGS